MAQRSDIRDGEIVRFETDKGNSIEAKFTLNQEYTATVTKLSASEESDDNVFKVTFKRAQGGSATATQDGTVGAQMRQKMGVCVFVLKCKAEQVPNDCLRRNTPLYKGTHYICKGNCGSEDHPTYFCLNCAWGKGNIQQCPVCRKAIKIKRKAEPEKVYDN